MTEAAALRTASNLAGTACPEYPPDVTSLVDVLAYQRARMPARPVCHRIVRRRDGLEAEVLTVEQLVGLSVRAAVRLRAAGVRDGDRVIVSVSDPHAFLVAFFGTLVAGAVAVPLPTAGELGAPRSFAARLRSVCTDCGPTAAVVERIDAFERVVGAMPAGTAVLEPHEPTTDAASGPAVLPSREGSAAAFIQYTSGSTGTPKGVVVTHGNILANCRAIRDATGYTRADRMVSWLPLHHDMGLVGGLLTSMYCAAETWLMPPMAFLARPVSWLEAMTRFGATLTVAPTFAYGLCARKIPPRQLARIDLSRLRLAYIGAEPVDRGTLEAFVERFRSYGLSPTAMYPVYGLAEATLAVAFPDPGHPLRYDTVDRRRLASDGTAAAAGDGVTFVSVGRALPRHRIEIVDCETGEPLGERRVGELVVEGPSVTPRYFGREPVPARRTLHTGDMAYVADGHVYVVDRLKDMVIIRGQSYAPSDIESVAAEVPGIRRGRCVAFSLPGDEGPEELYVVAELSPTSWRAPRAIADDVRRAILRDLGLSVATVAVVSPGTLERTSSGKVKRRASLDAFRAGTLRIVETRSQVVLQRLERRGERLGRSVHGMLAWIGAR